MNQHPGRRRRPALSCVECRRRKIKCNRSNPCVHWTSAGSQCIHKVYSSQAALRRPPERDDRLVSTPVVSVRSPLPATRRSTVASTTSNNHDGLAESHSISIPPIEIEEEQTLHHTLNLETEIRSLLQRVGNLERASASEFTRRENNTAQDLLTCQSGMYDAQSSLNKTRILRWSHWADEAPEVCLVILVF